MADRANDQTLKDTIRVYEKCGCNASAASQKLNLAVSAVQKRINTAIRRGLYVKEIRPKWSAEDIADAKELIEVWKAHHHRDTATAQAMHMDRSTFRGRRDKALRILGLEKAALVPSVVPEGMRMGKTTVQLGPDGTVLQEWRRLHPEIETLQAVADALVKIVDGKSPKLPRPINEPTTDLLLEIPFFDSHAGKYAWASETGGDDFDLKIFEKLMTGTVANMIAEAGEFGKALLVIGGDFFHADSRVAQTPQSHHALDVDSRFFKVWEVATRSLHTCIAMLSAKCAKVQVVTLPGNHDHESAFALMRVLSAYYHNEPQVEVVHNPRTRQYIRHGTCLLGFIHGEIIKMKDLPSLMAFENKKDWAETTERAWHMGHVHKMVIGDTLHGVTMEHLESFTSTDAWHAEHGYVGSPRRTTGFLWSAKWGLKKRIYVRVEEFV